MSDRKTPQPAGEIHLRQAVEVRLADQTRTLEIAVTLPTGATPEDIAQALQVATVGMRDLGSQLDTHVAALHVATQPAPLISSNGHHVPAAISAPDPEPAPAVTPSSPESTTELSMAGFLKAALELGYTAADIREALGENTLTGLDRVEALARLRELPSNRPTPISRGFAEEDGPDDAPEATESKSFTDNDLDMDEPDFGPVAEEARDDVFTSSAPPETPEVIAARQRDEAMRHLRTLRSIRAAGAAATPEQRTALANVVIGPLGRERAQELIIAIWHPAQGEKLNAPRTRALVEWAKEDDHFEETAEQVIALAQLPAPQEG